MRRSRQPVERAIGRSSWQPRHVRAPLNLLAALKASSPAVSRSVLPTYARPSAFFNFDRNKSASPRFRHLWGPPTIIARKHSAAETSRQAHPMPRPQDAGIGSRTSMRFWRKRLMRAKPVARPSCGHRCSASRSNSSKARASRTTRSRPIEVAASSCSSAPPVSLELGSGLCGKHKAIRAQPPNVKGITSKAGK